MYWCYLVVLLAQWLLPRPNCQKCFSYKVNDRICSECRRPTTPLNTYCIAVFLSLVHTGDKISPRWRYFVAVDKMSPGRQFVNCRRLRRVGRQINGDELSPVTFCRPATYCHLVWTSQYRYFHSVYFFYRKHRYSNKIVLCPTTFGWCSITEYYSNAYFYSFNWRLHCARVVVSSPVCQFAMTTSTGSEKPKIK